MNTRSLGFRTKLASFSKSSFVVHLIDEEGTRLCVKPEILTVQAMDTNSKLQKSHHRCSFLLGVAIYICP